MPGEKRKRVGESAYHASGFTVIGVGFERGDTARVKKAARSDIPSDDELRDDRAIAPARRFAFSANFGSDQAKDLWQHNSADEDGKNPRIDGRKPIHGIASWAKRP